MPRIYRTQNEYERFLIREFLRHLGYRISRPKWQDRPDALVTLSKGKSKKRAAIEHTDYFNDTVAGQVSPLTRVDEFWREVQASLIRRISQRKHLGGIGGWVRLKGHLPQPRNSTQVARQLARDVVDFLEANPITPRQQCRFSRPHFGGYTALQSLVASVLLQRWTDDPVRSFRSSWTCSNLAAGSIGLSLTYIKTAIKNKTKKAVNYTWHGANEKWLLIVASGTTLSNHAGPPTQNVDWNDGQLTALCRKSPFDRIIFWERIRDWYKSLKPNRPIVTFRNPSIG